MTEQKKIQKQSYKISCNLLMNKFHTIFNIVLKSLNTKINSELPVYKE